MSIMDALRIAGMIFLIGTPVVFLYLCVSSAKDDERR